MIQEITLTKRVQTPTPPNEWCYQDQGENFRYFTKKVILGANAEPWAECTEADRLAYEAEWAATHPEESRTLDTEDTTAVVEPNGDMPAEALRAEEGAGV
jgi:hypothetical protein